MAIDFKQADEQMTLLRSAKVLPPEQSTTARSHDRPDASIVIPLYNQGAYVCEAVASARRSTLENIEIIVVDDGSTEIETVNIVEHLERSGHTVVRQANGGLSAARNAGIAVASSPYILPLDADDTVNPTYLEKAVWLLDRHPDIGFVPSWVQCFGLSDELWAPKVTAQPHDWWLHNRAGPACVFRKVFWELVGGYDPVLPAYEDWDFWLSLLEAGATPHQIPEPLFHYRVKARSMYLDALAVNSELTEKIRQRHPAAAAVDHHHRWRLEVIEIARRFARTNTGSAVMERAWRDVSVAKHYGLSGWIKWRGFQMMSRIPGAVGAYRAIRSTRERDRSVSLAESGAPETVVMAAGRVQVRAPTTTGILFIVPWLQVGGADKINLDLIRGLDKTRYHPVVLTTLGVDHPQLRLFEEHVTDVFHLGSLPSSRREHLAMIEHLMKTRGVRIIQISNSELGYELLPEVRNLAHAVVSLVHVEDPVMKRDYISLAAARDQWVDRHVAVSERVAARLRHCGVGTEKVLMVPNGVDTDTFAPGESSWLAEVGLEAKKVITFVGRLVPQKDPILFVKSVHELLWRRHLDDVAVVVVGDGPLRDVVRSELEGLRSVCPALSLVASGEEEVARILRCSSVLVAPSQYEGMPIVGLEAMASRVPIVATRVPGWQELIRHGVTGLLTQPNPVAIANAIETLLIDSDRANAMAERGRQLALRDFSIGKMVDAYESVYQSVLGPLGGR